MSDVSPADATISAMLIIGIGKETSYFAGSDQSWARLMVVLNCWCRMSLEGD